MLLAVYEMRGVRTADSGPQYVEGPKNLAFQCRK